jgi:hypothetical protein
MSINLAFVLIPLGLVAIGFSHIQLMRATIMHSMQGTGTITFSFGIGTAVVGAAALIVGGWMI